MTFLYIDIESIPAQRPDVYDEIAATIKPPATYKKPESIAEWMKTDAPAAIDEAYRKTGLDGAFGQVCVIGVAIDDRPPVALFRPEYDEQKLIEDLGCWMIDCIAPSDVYATTVVGHNVSAFDLRFLMQRHYVNRMRPHTVIQRAAQAKPWETEKVFDSMIQWAGVGNRISLDKLCRALSIDSPKGELDGSMVWDYFQAGRIEEIAAYCLRDVEATRAVHKRMTFEYTPGQRADTHEQIEARIMLKQSNSRHGQQQAMQA